MCLQIPRVSCAEAAKFTFVRFVFAVSQFMIPKWSRPCGAEITHVTLVRLLSCVIQHVSLNVPRSGGAIVTQSTLVWFVPCFNETGKIITFQEMSITFAFM